MVNEKNGKRSGRYSNLALRDIGASVKSSYPFAASLLSSSKKHIDAVDQHIGKCTLESVFNDVETARDHIKLFREIGFDRAANELDERLNILVDSFEMNCKCTRGESQ